MKNNTLIYLAIIAILISLQLYQCQSNNTDTKALLEEINTKEGESKKREQKLILQGNKLIHQIDSLQREKEIVEQSRDSISQAQSKIIAKARTFTKEEADSAITDRFKSSTDVLVNILEHDSLKLRYRGLEEVYAIQQKELLKTRLLVEKKNERIFEKDLQLDLKDETIQVMTDDFKKKKRKVLFKGIGIGVGASFVTYLLVK